jgi:hypothetical protein
MTNGTIPTWNSIPVAGEEHGYLAVPENIPHYYDGNIPSDSVPGLFQLQVVAVGYDSAGNIPEDPPIQYQSPLYHRAKPFTPDDGAHEPRATFDAPHGHVSTPGWVAPGTDWTMPPPGKTNNATDVWAWVNVDGTIGTAPGTADQPNLSAYIAQVIAAADALKKFTQK